MMMKQTDLMVKSGIPQAQMKQASMQASALQGNSVSQTNANIAAFRTAQALTVDTSGIAQKIEEQQKQGAAQIADIMNNAKVEEPTVQKPETIAPNAFSGDLGKKIRVVFEGSEKLQTAFTNKLSSLGHTITNSDDADVTYWIGGIYSVKNTSTHKGFDKELGNLYENPDQKMELTEKGFSGKLLNGVGSLLGAIANKKTEPEEKKAELIKQNVLIVVARQLPNTREQRFRVLEKYEASELKPLAFSEQAIESLYSQLGI